MSTSNVADRTRTKNNKAAPELAVKASNQQESRLKK